MKDFDYELIDCGDGRRLERFGTTIVDRPCPQAIWEKTKNISEWEHSNAFYDREETQDWATDSIFPQDWKMKIDDIVIELRPSKNNQLGIFPEQLDNWRWMKTQIENANRPLKILNTFAYTGVATLMASVVGKQIEVCHVDGAKSSISWARRNAELSGLSDHPIRWIPDDIMKFLQREIKRGNKYDGIILDPPAFGRGKGGTWKIERDINPLLDLVNQLLSDNPCFVILSCHARELRSRDLARKLEELPALKQAKIEAIDLIIPSKKGNDLPLSICGRSSLRSSRIANYSEFTQE